MLILIAVLLVLFLACVAFSVDVAYMNLVHAELRTATDAAAKAAVTTLNLTNDDIDSARQAAKDVAQANVVAGRPLVLDDANIVFGRVEFQANGASVFRAGATPFAAARIAGQRTASSASGSVPLFFGSVLGQSAYEPTLEATAARLDCDVCLVVDRASSMRLLGKLAAMKTAVPRFLDALRPVCKQTQIGLVSFSTVATVNPGFTSDFDRINQVTAGLTADGLQLIGNGMNKGLTLLLADPLRQFNQKIMVLLSDGYQFQDEAGTQTMDPDTIARQAADRGVVIHTISLGPSADQALLARIAALTGGTYRHAADGTALQQAFPATADVIRQSRTAITILTQ
jgi:Mg-chelatase subunit ChlD